MQSIPSTCYSGGSSCSDSCTSGSATVGSGKCYTGTSNYINCSSCSSTTCYTGINTVCSYSYTSSNVPANSSPSGSTCTGYSGGSNGKCSGTYTTYYSTFACDSGYVKSGSSCVKEQNQTPSSSEEDVGGSDSCDIDACYSDCDSSYLNNCENYPDAYDGMYCTQLNNCYNNCCK